MSITFEEHLRTCLELNRELDYLFTPKKDKGKQSKETESKSKDEEQK